MNSSTDTLPGTGPMAPGLGSSAGSGLGTALGAGIAPSAVPAEGMPTALNARRLVWIRMIAVPGSALCMLLARQVYGLSVVSLPLLVIVGAVVTFNVWVWMRLKRPVPVSEGEFFVQMLVDLFALCAILYFTGGVSNPFIFFFLLPMTITAAALPRGYTTAMAVISALCYTILLFARIEVPEFVHHETAWKTVDLHVVGMWIGFVVIAALMAYFVAGMAETVRERDRYVAEMRESALRDERVVAVATLAAGAAHELSTPLATMAIVTGEILQDYPEQDYAPLHRQVRILRDQIARCKEALSVISASAGAARADAAERLPLDRFVERAVAEVRHLRPGAQLVVDGEGTDAVPQLVVERTIRQALLNILHNAVDVSPGWVRVRYAWSPQVLEISVIDRGGGLAGRPGAADRFGVSTKEGGLGLGLFLSHAAVSQAGGQLFAVNNGEGGTTVTMQLPLARLTGKMA